MTMPAVETPGGERIDQLVATVRTKAWLAALALLLVAACGASWALLGQVRDVVLATGVLVAGSGPVRVAAPVSGSLAEVLVRAGQEVTPGTPLAVLSDERGNRRVVTAAARGRVLRTAAPGATVAVGGTVAVVDPVTGPLRALLLVGQDRVGALTAGQPVTVGGTGGTGQGRVRDVDPYPASGELLRPLFGEALRADGRYLVTVDLDRPAWPGATLTPVSAEITVAVVRPVDALFPGGNRG
ncbi:biotin/lipoyl-binding protein [Acrocarpospora catenulata]|uniref:biotin/lipoyl-binding protein n=1 Tax=Acrocarpospora catenulata TaxID=2836182 RepID=UPI001BD986D8|nr:biotin/lipoyl-binding protein [Acrocarpospora catenulata]